MRCNNCGHENNDLATHCSACGASLGVMPSNESSPTGFPAPTESRERDTERLHAHGDAQAHAAATARDTQERTPLTPANDTQERNLPVPSASDTQERELAILEPNPLDEFVDAPQSHAESRFSRLGHAIRQHERALGLGLAALVVVILGGVWLVLRLTNTPTYGQIEADIAERLPTYTYAGGTYGPDLQIPLSSVTVSRRTATETPEGMEASSGVGPAAFEVTAEVTYDDGHIRVVHAVGATYARANDSWELVGELSDQGTSLVAESGVDEDKLIANMPQILQSVATQDSDDGEADLASKYEGAAFSIIGHDFEQQPDRDTSSDVVVIRCENSRGFYRYEGNVTARFAFESGTWQLRAAEADDDLLRQSYSGLEGTWHGDLVEHSAIGGNCYGAQTHPVTITVESIGSSADGAGQVQGTISGLAHYHERLDRDAESTAGDTPMEQQAFWGALSESYDASTGSSLNLEGTCAGGPDSELSFVVSFGTDDDPSAVVARVTSSYTYEETVFLLIPHKVTAEFTDTYVLTRVA